jgi:O-antigen ligase
MPPQYNPQRLRGEALPEGPAHVRAAGSAGIRSEKLRGRGRLAPGLIVILAYILLTRLSLGNEANYGIWIGSVPIYPTDVTLVLLIGFVVWRRWRWFQNWFVKGKGSGPIGRAVWCLCILAVVYAVRAWPSYQILALRDLAMFGYSLFFPLTYVVINDRHAAVRIVRWFVYGSLILAVPLALEAIIGLNLGLSSDDQSLMTASGLLRRIAVGDLGSNLGFALSALLVYLLLTQERRWINSIAALICLVGIAASLSRSAILSVAAATLFTFLIVRKSRRLVFGLSVGVVGLWLLGHSSLFQNLTAAVKSGTTIFDDADFQFRLLRWGEAVILWLTHPVIGAGFGVEICTPDPNETGLFNVGMPHNSYLTLLARTGIVGLGLFLFCYGKGLLNLLKSLRNRGVDADSLAVANILIAMGIFAGFNLFLEEPLLIGPFWIMLAVACRLAETSPARLVVARRRLPAPESSRGLRPAATPFLRPSLKG